MNFEDEFSEEEFNNGVGMYSVPPPPIDDFLEEDEFFFEDDDDPKPDLILHQYNQRPLVPLYDDNDEDNSSSSEQNLIELETLYGYRRAENLPGFIILNSAPGQPGHTSCFIADFDLKNEASQTQEEQKKMMMMETQASDIVIEKEELLPPQQVEDVTPSPPTPPTLPSPPPAPTNAWGTGGIYKTLNIRDPMEIAKMAKEQEEAEAKIAAAAAATAAAKAKTYATNTNTNNNRRFRGGRDTRDMNMNNMNNHHTTAARVSILRPKAEEHKEGSVSSTTTTSSTKDNYQQVSRGRGGGNGNGDKQQPVVDENAPRMDLLCKFSENRHSSRDRKKCMRSHSLEAWVPRTCHRSQCTNQACNYFHATKETKKEFLERLVNSETSFYYSFRNDFRRLYL